MFTFQNFSQKQSSFISNLYKFYLFFKFDNIVALTVRTDLLFYLYFI